ncbi:MAG: DCC1-like thiol-disulfide oxidoreductase family protein [Bacteroidia bacterium]|jgi:predicted DCC family thiol-disulfide oxidoreductase YuxK|nr:DCC1-like thiol-disulfide oxidoreductase family protein [Bacteroidia bacterium]
MMNTHPILFYDGLCGLCDKSVQFILKHDRKKTFRFAPLQSDFAKETLGHAFAFDSVVLYHQNKTYFRSTAALRVLKLLGGFWMIPSILLLVPTFIRNAIYDFVARNRYKWFGKFDTCKIPTPEQRELFLG